jgi:hypothetical protein
MVTRVSNKLWRALLVLVSILVLCSRIYPQVAGATLSGTVHVTTDAAGFYSVPNSIRGTYEVTASAPGFATAVQRAFTLTVAKLSWRLSYATGVTPICFRCAVTAGRA